MFTFMNNSDTLHSVKIQNIWHGRRAADAATECTCMSHTLHSTNIKHITLANKRSK